MGSAFAARLLSFAIASEASFVFTRVGKDEGRLEEKTYEIELVAHGDGGFYHRHIDTFTGSGRSRSGDRVVSCVYYFHSRPKQFAGGELRLYPLPTRVAPAPEPIDVAPEHDTLVAFSSWMPHEVMPTVCPTKQFKDYRFSINCWVYQQSEPAAAQDV